MAKKSMIYCEVTCRHCGLLANKSGNYSSVRIKALKEETKDWIIDEEYEILCPQCRIQLGKL